MNAFRTMALWMDDYSRIQQYDENTIIADRGLYRGSCGAPYITPDGLVIAMHVACMHEGKNVSLIKRKRSRTAMINGKTVVDVDESATDLDDVHASIKVGPVLSIIPEITNFVTTHNGS